MSGENSTKSPKVESVETDDPGDESCRTFIIHNEDHTLGNALRYMIMKNPETEFCGYCIPHPSEDKINLRIQSRGRSALDLLKKGLCDLTDVCDTVLHKFEVSVETYESDHQNRMDVDS